MTALEAPHVEFDDERIRQFESVWASRRDGFALSYGLSYPKWQFLSFLVNRHAVLLRGTNRLGVDLFRPVPQTDYFGRVRRAVFATSDGIWPIFFAIVDRTRYHGSLANRCEFTRDTDGVIRKVYSFSVNAVALTSRPWSAGAVYVLPREGFQRVSSDAAEPSEEWCSESAVQPLCYLEVEPGDFPFLAQVEGHGDEAWHRFEELAYGLAIDASAVELADRVCVLSFAERQRVARELEAFMDLTQALLPDVATTVTPLMTPGVKLELSGDDTKVRQIGAAMLNWRS